MAKFIPPASFQCDCGIQLDFFESTIIEMKNESKNRQMSLGVDKHSVVFINGEYVKIRCPQLKTCKKIIK